MIWKTVTESESYLRECQSNTHSLSRTHTHGHTLTNIHTGASVFTSYGKVFFPLTLPGNRPTHGHTDAD